MDTHDFLDNLIHFSHVVSAGGYNAASKKYGIPKSRLSRRVVQLEQRLGVALLNRSNNQFTLTTTGIQIYKNCQNIQIEADQVLAKANSAVTEAQGELRISCPVVITQTIVSRIVANFAREHPSIRIALEASNRLPDPIADRFDLVICPTPDRLKNSDLIARKIGTGQYVFVCHPDLQPAQPVDNLKIFHDLPMLAYGTNWGHQQLNFICPDGSKQILHFEPIFLSDNLIAIKEAALAGVGAAALPTNICENDLREGRLVYCCPSWHPMPMIFYALYPSRLSLTAAGRLFLSFLQSQLQKELDRSL